MGQSASLQKNRARDLKPWGLAAGIIIITLLHYSTSTQYLLLHEIYQRLYYIPIIYAAYSYGLRGGLAASALSALIYIPHIAQHSDHQDVYAINQFAEMILFQVVGAVTGLLAGAERRERQRYEQTAAELQRAYDELRSTVDQLLLADRHSSLGRMSAAIVHEIRNPLGAIRGAAEALEAAVPRDHEKAEFLAIIEREVEQLNGLVGEFLQFARPRSPELLLTPPREIIESVVKLTGKQAAQSLVQIEVNVADDLQFLAKNPLGSVMFAIERAAGHSVQKSMTAFVRNRRANLPLTFKRFVLSESFGNEDIHDSNHRSHRGSLVADV